MNCPFCQNEIYEKEGILRNRTCIFLSGSGYNPEGVLVGAGIIIPFSHKETPFDLNEDEIQDMFSLLNEAKQYLDKQYKPDGYSLGWNIGETSGQAVNHVHLHVMPRYNDEPLAGKGIRHFLKQESNRRNRK
jgi:histidine triad (HIT) family protein